MIHPLWGILIVRCAPPGHGSSHVSRPSAHRASAQTSIFIRIQNKRESLGKFSLAVFCHVTSVSSSPNTFSVKLYLAVSVTSFTYWVEPFICMVTTQIPGLSSPHSEQLVASGFMIGVTGVRIKAIFSYTSPLS